MSKANITVEGYGKMLIHDLEHSFAADKSDNYTTIISAGNPISHCIGCFGCWIKTPGVCVIKDKYGNMGADIAKCNEIIIVTKCCYGGPSPFVKNVLDRSISYVHPYFVNRNGEMHHKQRYEKSLNLTVLFYGDNLTSLEKQTAQEWVKAMAVNLYCVVQKVVFCENPREIEVLI